MSSQSPSNLSREAVREFLIETQESLEQVEAELIKLENNPLAADAASPGISRMFRILHSIKGTCGFLGYPKLEELAHVGENLLGRIREGILPIDATVVTALLSIVDANREVLDHIESENNEGNQDYTNLTQQLSQILGSGEFCDSAAEEASVERRSVVDNSPPTSDSSQVQQTAKPDSPDDSASTPPSDHTGLNQSESIVGSLGVSNSYHASDVDQTSSQSTSSYASRATSKERGKTRPDSKVADSTLRIDVALLDKMMMLAGELVQTRNQLLQDESLENDGPLRGNYRQLNSITSELQDCIMKSRMQPISTIWNQMPRMVRDVALGAFKQVRLEMEGGETELDKTIIEAIRDPLTHVLRNAVDHGLELPELRAALGKPVEGQIWMRAYHAGGQVNIEIEDDGAGIDAQAIRRKAIERNLATPSQVEQMSDMTLLGLIFQPGFSTTARVTRLSGRGVGLDVVKSNIEKLGGAIHVQSTFGKGTTFALRIPLTLAIVQAVIVEAAGDAYVVPQSRIVELIRLHGEEAKAVLDAPCGVPDFRFRGRLLPIVHLRDVLGLETIALDSLPQDISLIVLKVHDRQFGLVVDSIIDNQEVVIKPLWQPLRVIPTYAGATQLANGSVALILDPVGLVKRAGLIPERHEETPKVAEVEPEQDTRLCILTARLDQGGSIALPTTGLKRIEEMSRSQIKKLQDQAMMEYDGKLVPLINLDSLLHRGDSSSSEADTGSLENDCDRTHVALYDANGETIGLIVGPVVDIERHSLDVRGKATRPYVDFTTVIDDRFVEFLDLEGIIGSADMDWASDQALASTGD